MRFAAVLVAAAAIFAASVSAQAEEKSKSVLNHKMKSLDGQQVDLAKKYKGKVVLVVNVASQCGLTPHYEGLQALHEKLGKEGLAVAGFPCNQFGRQEPGTAQEIRQFCTDNYNVSFDMFDKVEVNGEGACKLYKQLTAIDSKPAGKGKVQWNFEKFLIGRDGQVVARFAPRTKPDDPKLLKAIKGALAEK